MQQTLTLSLVVIAALMLVTLPGIKETYSRYSCGLCKTTNPDEHDKDCPWRKNGR